MQHHGNTPARSPGRRKQIVLALGLALGLATAQGQASPAAGAASHAPADGPAAALMRRAAEAGIAIPADLPKFMARRAKAVEKAGHPTPQATHTVTNCNDSGPGSLRAAVASATSGDIIDLTGSGCTSALTPIALTSSIVTSVNDLTIRRGPEAEHQKYVIHGGNNGRVFTHNGTGTLTLDGVTVRSGKVTGTNAANPAQGGCVFSQGNVELTNQAQVKYCEATTSANGAAQGGAVFAANTVTVHDGGRITKGKAISTSGNALGGGIHAAGVELSGALIEDNLAQVTGAGIVAAGGGIHTERLEAKYSVIRDNRALIVAGASGVGARSGGAEIGGNGGSSIKYSTFSGNTADASGATNGGGSAITFGRSSTAGSFEMRSSTLANNASINSTKYGGALALRNDATIRSSTISGNTERNAADKKYGAGITLDDGVQLTMTSSIAAGNHLIPASGGNRLSDIGLSKPDEETATVVGTQNFRNWVDTGITWPSGNFGGLPAVKLGPLQDNGGLTQTMLPLPDSPVIDSGGTTGIFFDVDQRGEGFPRIVGPQADIGAVEWSTFIFSNGFED